MITAKSYLAGFYASIWMVLESYHTFGKLNFVCSYSDNPDRHM